MGNTFDRIPIKEQARGIVSAQRSTCALACLVIALLAPFGTTPDELFQRSGRFGHHCRHLEKPVYKTRLFRFGHDQPGSACVPSQSATVISERIALRRHDEHWRQVGQIGQQR